MAQAEPDRLSYQRFARPLRRATTLLALALLACASSQPGRQSAGAVQPEPMRLALEYALQVDGRQSATHILEIRPGEVYETERVMQRLDEIMHELTSAVADSLASSTAVKWVLTQPNPRLSPDHTLRLTFRSLTWAEGREEGTQIPRVRLDVTILRASDHALVRHESLWATGAELHLRRARDLNLVVLYRNAGHQIRELVEAERRR